MNSERKIVKAAGALLIVQMTTAIISYSIIVEPILYGSDDFLAEVAEQTNKVRIAAILDFITTLVYFGIAVLLFPILKQYSERIALWFAGIKLSEFVTFTVSGIFLLTIVSISNDYVGMEASENSNLKSLGKHLVNARVHTQNLNLLTYCFGGWLFYYLLFAYRLVPRFISVWGIIGVFGLFTEISLSLFGSSSGSLVYILGMPLGLNEIFLGVWLMVKGFNTSSIQPDLKIEPNELEVK